MTKNLMTPFGVASYPYLNTPDRKFAGEGDPGVYKVDLVVTEEEARAFINKAEAAWKAGQQERGLAKKKADAPWFEQEDDDTGEPTGKWIIRLKQKEFRRTKNGDIPNKVVLIDAHKQPMSEVIGGGSEIRVQVLPYVWEAQGRCGITLQPLVVQTRKLVQGAGGGSLDDFDEVDGYEAVESHEPVSESSGDEDF